MRSQFQAERDAAFSERDHTSHERAYREFVTYLIWRRKVALVDWQIAGRRSTAISAVPNASTATQKRSMHSTLPAPPLANGSSTTKARRRRDVPPARKLHGVE